MLSISFTGSKSDFQAAAAAPAAGKVLWWYMRNLAGAESPAASRRSILQASSLCLHTFLFSEQRPAPNQASPIVFFSSIYLLLLYPGVQSAISILGRCCSSLCSFFSPFSHENRSPKNLGLGLSFMSNFFLPCLHSYHLLSAVWSELCSWESIAGSSRNWVGGGLNFHLVPSSLSLPFWMYWRYIQKWRANTEIHRCTESQEISGTIPSSGSAVAGWQQKSWRQQVIFSPPNCFT